MCYDFYRWHAVFLAICIMVHQSCNKKGSGRIESKEDSVQQNMIKEQKIQKNLWTSISAASSDSNAKSFLEIDDTDLESMSVRDLLILRSDRQEQNQNEQTELKLIKAINEKLCETLENKRTMCAALKRISFYPSSEVLQCAASENQESRGLKIEVTIPENKDGSFILLANDTYMSSEFGPGKSEVTFSDNTGDLMSPQFIKIYKLKIRLSNKFRGVMPDTSGFFIKIEVDGQELLHELVQANKESSDRSLQTEYDISIKDIIDLRTSESCMINDRIIEEIKQKAKDTIIKNQVYEKTENLIKNNLNDDKKTIIRDITDLRESISERFRSLESERNRQFKLTNELKTDVHLGCQIRQPVRSFIMELEGNINDRVYIGKFGNKKSDKIYDGSSYELLFDFGAARFSIDFSKMNPFGTKFIYEKDISRESIVKNIDRILIRKKGVSYDNVETSCRNNGGLFGTIEKLISDDTCYDIYEEGVIHISGITLYINDKKAYSRNNLDINLSRKSPSYIGENFQSNEDWIRLMLDDTCITSD